MRGADLLAKTMVKAGVTTVFSLSGNQIMPLYDALYDTDIRIIHTRHEAAAVYMAEAYAQLTGKFGVALVTAGPGFANALGALYSPKMSETPVVLLSGDSPVSLDNRGAFQAMAQSEMSHPLVKSAERPVHAEELGISFAAAVSMAQSGRKGPVHLALPQDVLTGEVTNPLPPDINSFAPIRTVMRNDDIDFILAAFRSAQRPLVITGPRMSKVREGDLGKNLAISVGVPVVNIESPRGLKDPAIGAFSAVLDQADLVVFLGKPVDYAIGFATAQLVPAERIVVVNADDAVFDQAQTNLEDRLTRNILAEPVEFAKKLISQASNDGHNSEWMELVQHAVAKRITAPEDGTILPHHVAQIVQKIMQEEPNPILICDGGEFGQWTQAHTHTDRRVFNGMSGAIGAAVPYAIAAKTAEPDASVVALLGDGTAGFYLAEFETAAREGLAIVAIIGNDCRWNAEHMLQVREYGPDRTHSCDLNPNARYDLVALALGCDGEQVTELSQLEPAIRNALKSGKPTCIDVRITGVAAPVVG